MGEEFRKLYAEKQQKYDLPSFDELNADFGIILIVDGKQEFVGELLVAVRHKMVEAFNGWTNYLHSFYIPAPNFVVSMKEHEAMTEDDNKRLFQVIAKLSLWIKKSFKVSLNWKDESGDVDYIKNIYKEFIDIKEELNYFLDKNITTWEDIVAGKVPEKKEENHFH